jgi:hypothetical protein
MSLIRAHFDGRVFVPEEPVQLPKGKTITLKVVSPKEKRPLRKRRPLYVLGSKPVKGGLPDASINHDKYIYTGM